MMLKENDRVRTLVEKEGFPIGTISTNESSAHFIYCAELGLQPTRNRQKRLV